MSNVSEDDKAVWAELEADRTYNSLPDREKNFLQNFLGSVTGDRSADGMNFQADLRSYKYKGSDKLYTIYTKFYPKFAAMSKTEAVDDIKPEKMPQTEGVSVKMGMLEKLLEGLLKKLGWKPSVTVKQVKDGLKATLEDWSEHDPAAGKRGGKMGAVTLVALPDDLGLRWEWEDSVEETDANEVEALFIEHKPEIRDIVDSIEKK